MEVNFFNTMDEIIERLEENDFETYAYNGNLFHIIDKNECIDFQIKFGINNYHIKDNENKKMYMFVKKYLDETTTVQTILYNNNNEQFYYSFLEKDGNIRMAKLIRKCGDEYLLCSNTELLGKTDTELLKYAYENLNSYEVEIDENGIVVPEFNKDELCSDEYGENYMEDYSEDDEENEEFIDEEDEEICNVSEDDLLENFEEITISEFVNSIYEQAEEGSSKYYKDKDPCKLQVGVREPVVRTFAAELAPFITSVIFQRIIIIILVGIIGILFIIRSEALIVGFVHSAVEAELVLIIIEAEIIITVLLAETLIDLAIAFTDLECEIGNTCHSAKSHDTLDKLLYFHNCYSSMISILRVRRS